MSQKIWGGRFNDSTDELVERFTESVSFDKALAPFDIKGSIAHAKMLARQGIISDEDARKIINGLENIKQKIDAGEFEWDIRLEDVHMNIEAALSKDIGDAGKRLHTARSRNDQVATDVRLYLKHEAIEVDGLIGEILYALLEQAKKYKDIVMPGLTHLQHAQPVLWSHYMMAYFEQFRRDKERILDAFKRIDVMPLGSGSIAGVDFPVDRDFVMKELGFSSLSRNSMDAVSDRDFIAEFIFCSSLIMVHLSRLSEDLVLWASQEFDFVELPESYCTGSSIMPQKKNPDCPEIIRAKTGRVIGDLVSILTILKGLPMTYNRDLQEDKEPLFDTCTTVKMCLKVMTGLLHGLIPKKERLMEACKKGFLTATDLADYLVEKGVAFRTAHEIVGRAVSYCAREGKELWELSIDELRSFHPLIGEDCFDAITISGSINRRRSKGGTALEQVNQAIKEAEEWLKGQSS